ncbi:hypothetical protein CK203_098048 [Vitis vinifera]|uniref:Uncharacterized protein n=1 Tax=Vitis vinifera TaxID=29760 RepID=A0A438CS75_VITVI|nr:hypothetical protein CK203_098048 [Vitis vinifera]
MLSSGYEARECRVLLPEVVRIGERATCPSLGSPDGVAPDSEAHHMSLGGKGFFGGFDRVLGLGFLLPPCAFCGLLILLCGKAKGWDMDVGSVSTPLSKMSANKDVASSSAAGQSGKDASGEVHAEKSVDKLNVREFCERFCIPNDVSVHLVDGEAVSTKKSTDNAIYFTKEQFNDGLRFPLPFVLSVLFDLDLSLLEALFIYSIKKGKNDIHSFVASLLSLQLVASMPDSTKGAARGHVLVKGLWAVRKEDARARKALLNEREERRQEGTLRKAPGDKRSAPTPPAGAPARKKKKPGLLALKRCLLWRLHGRNGAERQGLPPCESSSLTFVPVKGPATRRSRPARDLKSDISGRLQDRLLETIEVSCSSAQENHPEGSETEMAEDNPIDPVLVPDEGSPEEIQPAVNNGGPKPREELHPSASSGGSPVDDVACISASPFSYAELGEMLKRILPGSDVVVPSAKMFEVAEMLVSGIRGMVQQHHLFSDLLRIFDHMKAFVSQRMSGEEELRSRLEQAEASLSTARRASEESVETLKSPRMTTRLSG